MIDIANLVLSSKILTSHKYQPSAVDRSIRYKAPLTGHKTKPKSGTRCRDLNRTHWGRGTCHRSLGRIKRAHYRITGVGAGRGTRALSRRGRGGCILDRSRLSRGSRFEVCHAISNESNSDRCYLTRQKRAPDTLNIIHAERIHRDIGRYKYIAYDTNRVLEYSAVYTNEIQENANIKIRKLFL